MKYELPLFFVCVRTNVGYSVAAQYIVQSESVECITEVLNILKEWNPSWCPPFFMCDFSHAKLSALQDAFPDASVYGCDFHREQAWTRWVRDRKNGLNKIDADCLLELLRACAWAPPGDDSELDANYQKAVSILKSSSVWRNNVPVQTWLNSNWLQYPQVSALTYIVVYQSNDCNILLILYRDGHVLSEIMNFMQLLIRTMAQRLRISYLNTSTCPKPRLALYQH